MLNKIIVQVAEGLGNQLFMYAHAYALSKKTKSDLFIDDVSGFYKKKNRLRGQKFMLDKLQIDTPIIDNSKKTNSIFKYIRKKISKSIDVFRSKKKFLLEKKIKINSKKTSSYENYDINNFFNEIFIEGHYECEKYFIESREDILKKFRVKKNLIKDNKYKDFLINSNSVSIHIRRHKYSEQSHEKRELKRLNKSENYTQNIISYIKKSVAYFEKILSNPKFFIWTNDFYGIEKDFDPNKFVYVQNNDSINDFRLFSFAKHFIVGGSSYHWWGAWLNTYKNKICTRPPDQINSSDNVEFYPDKWINTDE